eukprot:9466315-Pyramimonas_sp.AAC.1
MGPRIRSRPARSDFKILGADFDCKFLLTNAVRSCAHERGWRLQSLMRTRRVRTNAELVLLYKAHVLSFIEYETCAFTHASNSVLASLDRVQSSILRNVGTSDLDALHLIRPLFPSVPPTPGTS